MDAQARWDVTGVDAVWCAAPIDGGTTIGHRRDQPVSPGSVMKIQVALAVGSAIDGGRLDGTTRVWLGTHPRTPGPVGMSLMTDPVEMSLRDLLVPMITISDNVATDALIGAVGLDAVNATTDRLGLSDTRVVNDVRSMLNEAATDVGFVDYSALADHDPATEEPSIAELMRRLAASATLDPARGSRTTPVDMVRLMSLIWTDSAGPAASCASLRSLMGRQLIRRRIASGFGSGYAIAAKSGGLLGIVRNEVGVVTDPLGRSFAVAIFTRRRPDSPAEPSEIDAAIGALARGLVDELRFGPN